MCVLADKFADKLFPLHYCNPTLSSILKLSLNCVKLIKYFMFLSEVLILITTLIYQVIFTLLQNYYVGNHSFNVIMC